MITAQAALDALVYTERSVYRSGETVFITALLRDGQGMGVVSAPLTLVVKRPDGVEYKRVQSEDEGSFDKISNEIEEYATTDAKGAAKILVPIQRLPRLALLKPKSFCAGADHV